MVCEPTASADVAKLVCPLPSSVPVPSTFAPSLNVTVPVATETPLVLTVALNVTRSPKFDGFVSELILVLVGQTPLSATSAVNGVLVSPDVVKLRMSPPAANPP